MEEPAASAAVSTEAYSQSLRALPALTDRCCFETMSYQIKQRPASGRKGRDTDQETMPYRKVRYAQ